VCSFRFGVGSLHRVVSVRIAEMGKLKTYYLTSIILSRLDKPSAPMIIGQTVCKSYSSGLMKQGKRSFSFLAQPHMSTSTCDE